MQQADCGGSGRDLSVSRPEPNSERVRRSFPSDEPINTPSESDPNLIFIFSSDRRPALAKEMVQSNSRPVIVATVFHFGFEGV